MQKNRKHVNTFSYIWPNDLWQQCQNYSVGMEQPFQQMVLGKMDIQMQKNEFGSFSYIQKWKSIKDLNLRPPNYENLRRKQDPINPKQSNLWHRIWQWFLSLTPKTQVT